MLKQIQTTNYKNYPECMFAMLSAFVPAEQADVFRRLAGDAVFRSEESNGDTYKNGLLHSFDDLPAVNDKGLKMWYKNGKPHREGDKPAIIDGNHLMWMIDGLPHREGDLPAVIDEDNQEQEWYKNGKPHREGGLPVKIQGNMGVFIQDGVYLTAVTDEQGNWNVLPRREQESDDEEYYEDLEEYYSDSQ